MTNDYWLYRLNCNGEYFYNMAGDYSYLSEGYYRSLDWELAGIKIKPTTEEALDAYVVPLAMKKAEQSKIKTPKYEIVTEKITPPALAYPINPFSSKFAVITQKEEVQAKLKALTMGGKYAVLSQTLPEGSPPIVVIRSIMGMTPLNGYEEFTSAVFRVFQIPLMKVRAIVAGEDILLSAIEPLAYNELSAQEEKALLEVGTWQK